jgi:predicted ester cyclase
MSPEGNKAIVRRYLEEVWNKKNRAILDEVVAPDLVQHVRNVSPGREGIHRFFAMMDHAFPNARMTIEDMIGEADKVMWSFTIHATHTGPFRDIQPTGNPITLTGRALTRMRDGQMAENWNETDDLGMMQQLGMVPSASS